MIVAALLLALLGMVCFMVRAVMGPSLADRVMAVDAIVVTIVAVVLLESARSGSRYFLDVAVVVGFIGFVGTAAAARFIERRGG